MSSGMNMRFGLSLLTAALCHGLLFGLGLVLPAPAPEAPSPPEKVEVDLVPARPDPVQDMPPMAASEPPAAETPPAARAIVKRSSVRPPLRPAVERPAAVASATTDEPSPSAVSFPPSPSPSPSPEAPSAAAPRQAGASSATATPPPAAITVLARPRYRSNPTPEYPLAAKRGHEEGVVLLTVDVGADGRPSDVSLKQSSGHPSLDQAAIDAVRGWTFEPARAGAVPVASQVVVPVRFSLAQR